MKRKTFTNFFFFLLLTSYCILNLGWGFWAHKRINRLAVFTLPGEMITFYKKNIDYVTEHAIDADRRRYAVDTEAPRHYIDLDHYGKFPFDDFPRHWKDAVEKYTEDTLRAYGILPWNVQNVYYDLVDAFKEKSVSRILRLSADIGHYIADAHVPLHTSENYNGQLTGQKGIHGFWESRLPELFGESYNYFTGKARLIRSPLDEIWKAILESHAALDSVLSFEKQLTEKFPPDKKYSYEKRGSQTVRVYSLEFSTAYHEMLKGQVERRMRMAVKRIGDFWYTAWNEAGKPNLTELLKTKLTREERLKLIQEQKEWEKGKIKGTDREK